MSHEVLIRTSGGRHRFFIDDDFCHSLSVPVSKSNWNSIQLFIASWLTLLADSPLDSDKKPLRTYRRFLSRISSLGIKEIVLSYSDLAHKFVSQHTLMGIGTSIGPWIDEFRDTPVFFEYHRYFQTGDPVLLRFIYNFLCFGKKLEYVDPAFEEVALRDWLDIEKRLDDLVFESEDIASLKRILHTLLPPFSFQDLRPKFGPGSVQEKGVRGRIEKIRSFSYDPLIDRFLLHGHIGKYGFGEDSGIRADKIIPDPSVWSPARRHTSRIARLRFVPKNLKTARSICMEPNVLMYFQQAVASEFLNQVNSSVYSRFINIRDQSRNQYLSEVGSYSSLIDTIDLSAASDSLSFQLVKRIFPSSWLIPMIVSRSHSCYLPNGDIHHLSKFAPMGSAMCFPTQCLVFATVCIYAACLMTYETEKHALPFLDWLSPSVIIRVSRSFMDDPRYTLRRFQPLAVYGDDICLDRRLTDIVMSILDRLGFSVNKEKSFTGSQSFRESCGKYFLDGHDITPLYFRVKGVKRSLSVSHIVSQVHLINECWNRKYKNTYRFLRSSIMTWECRKSLRRGSSTNSIPYVDSPQNFGILVSKPVNNHLRVRFNEDYQRDEYLSWTISYESSHHDKKLLSSIDAYEYMRWWAGRRGELSNDSSESVRRYDTGGSRVQWRWMPLY